MPSDAGRDDAAALIERGRHVMAVCNACRYCEQYCPVFPAMENRRAFTAVDLTYLANLCHNCGECLYACQYAPPHEFGINVPRTLAELRLESYEMHAWPAPAARLFRRQGGVVAIVLTLVFTAVMVAASILANGGAYPDAAAANFYDVVPHDVLVTLFGVVFVFALVAIGVAATRFARDVQRSLSHASGGAPEGPVRGSRQTAIVDALTLRHLHSTGIDCTDREEHRAPWRRWWHHLTFYGFALCFASTTAAAVYHTVFGWVAPYGYTSLPVVLGAVGGVGLVLGPAGLLVLHRKRDPSLADPGQRGLDTALVVLLIVTSMSGLLLLVLRDEPIMRPLLMLHLGSVLALFATLPYGKFVHGVFRAIALFAYSRER